MALYPSILGLIPARGGSKRFPGKNIAAFQGKPLIAHTIERAIESDVLDRVVVSTDSPDIAAVAAGYGAEVPFIRPADIALDTSTSEEVIDHALNYLHRHEGYFPDFVLLLQPTSPLRSAKDIQNAVRLLLQHDAEAVVSVSRGRHSSRILIPQRNGTLAISDDGHYLPGYFSANGALYLVQSSFFLKHQSLYPEKTYPYVMPQSRTIDIDTVADLERATLV